MKSAKTFDDLKSQLESSGIKIAVDDSDFHKAFDEMKGAETAYTKQKEQIAIANAKTEKKISAELFRRRLHWFCIMLINGIASTF